MPEPVKAPLEQAVTYKDPLAVAATQPAEAREDKVVEPFTPMVNRAVPVEEATVKGVTPPAAWTVKVEVLVVVPTANKLETVVEPVTVRVEPVLFQRKLAEEAVLEAALA